MLATLLSGFAPKKVRLVGTIVGGGGEDPNGVPSKTVEAYPVCRDTTTNTNYHRLDSLYPQLDIEHVRGITEVWIYIKPGSASVAGNIVLVPSVSGIAQTKVVVPVTATETVQKITFATAITGSLRFTRDMADAEDTLKSAGASVTAIVATDIHVR